MIRFIARLFRRNCIGAAALKPWMGYKFASGSMTPRFDEDGNIYMLVCDQPAAPKGEQS